MIDLSPRCRCARKESPRQAAQKPDKKPEAEEAQEDARDRPRGRHRAGRGRLLAHLARPQQQGQDAECALHPVRDLAAAPRAAGAAGGATATSRCSTTCWRAEPLRRFDLTAAAGAAAQGGRRAQHRGADGHARRPGHVHRLSQPHPRGQALLVPLLNPREVVRGQRARLGDPVLLDLGRAGDPLAVLVARALPDHRRGDHGDGGTSHLYTWSGRGPPRGCPAVDLRASTPRRSSPPRTGTTSCVFSDDGGVRSTACAARTSRTRRRNASAAGGCRLPGSQHASTGPR